MGMLKDFKEFAVQGNMVDMAVGIVLGAAFGTVVQSLVSDIITPMIAALFKMPDFSNLFIHLRAPDTLPEGIGSFADITSIEEYREAGGVALGYGNFINALIAFILVAFALWIIVRGINRVNESMKKEEEESAPEPAGPSELDVLLEIRDSLKR